MASHNLSETEFYEWMSISFARLESQLQTIFNELQSIRIAREAPWSPTLPPPASAIAPSQPTLNTTPRFPPTTFVPMNSFPSRPIPTPTSPSFHAPSPKPHPHAIVLKLLPRSTHAAIPPLKWSPSTILPPALKVAPTPSTPDPNVASSVVPNQLKQPMKSFFSKDKKLPLEEANEKREWRPPWRFAETCLYVTGRTKWRPPWGVSFEITGVHLEDKVNSSGVDCYVPGPLSKKSKWLCMSPTSSLSPRSPQANRMHAANKMHFYLSFVI